MEVQILIDDRRVPVTCVIVHSQSRPNPGGHLFEVIAPHETASQWLKAYLQVFQKNVRDVNSVLDATDELAAWIYDSHRDKYMEHNGPSYVINVIRDVRLEQQCIVIQGECSEFQKTYRGSVDVE